MSGGGVPQYPGVEDLDALDSGALESLDDPAESLGVSELGHVSAGTHCTHGLVAHPCRRAGLSGTSAAHLSTVADSTAGDEPGAHDDERPSERAPVPRKLLAELVGTYFATLVTAGIEVVAVLEPGEIDRVVKAAAPSLVAAGMIYALGDLSGAHFNPAVTLVFAVRRDFPKRLVLPYWVAQFAGAIAAALTLRALFGTVRDVGISRLDGVTEGRGFVIEIIITALLVLVTLNAAHEHSLIGTQAAIAVAATMAACRMVAGELTSASMNPARSVGPAVAAAAFDDLWVFVAGPVVGALAALGITVALRPHRNRDEHEAAQGK